MAASKPSAEPTAATSAAKKTAAGKKTVAGKTPAAKRAAGGDGAPGSWSGAGSGSAPDPAVPDIRHFRGSGHTHESLGLSPETVLDMYRNMLLQRRFEERSAQMYGRQKIAGFLHLYIGQEAVSTGAVWAVDDADPIITAYRDHGLGLARGMDPGACMAELFGKEGGSSKGKGGSMHFFDAERHFYGGHGIVGGQIPVGVGLGFAMKYKGQPNCSLTFFGDGAINQGAFHEAMNLAALYDVPALICVENNEYAMGTSVERARGDADLSKSAYPYGMKAAVVDGMDLFEVYHAFKTLGDEARGAADGVTQPIFVEIQTYRYRGHSMSDPQKYRTKEELEGKKNEDPILRVKAYLLEHKLFDIEALDAVDDEVKQTVKDAVAFAEASPFPAEESMYDDVYVQEDYPFIA